jgi:hypothetical protein
MNDRERFLQIASFKRPGDPFFFAHWFWIEAWERWVTEGLPPDANPYEVLSMGQDRVEFLPVKPLFDIQGRFGNPPYALACFPRFSRVTVKDEGETAVVRETDGTLYRVFKKDAGRMPEFITYPIQDRATWKAYKKNLDPETPERYLEGWKTISRTTYDREPALLGRPWSERTFPLGLPHAFTTYGVTRNLLGVEALSYLLFDDRALVEEIMDHLLYLTMEVAKKVFAAGIVPDFAYMWEDMCFKNGPLMSPRMIRELMIPRYRIMTAFLKKNGVPLLLVDCDGDIRELIPLLLEGGVEGVLPLEVQAGMDPVALRKQYGRDLVLAGGLEKQELSKDEKAIDRELETKLPFLLEQGGYFVCLDHMAPPNIPLKNYLYFVRKAKSLARSG